MASTYAQPPRLQARASTASAAGTPHCRPSGTDSTSVALHRSGRDIQPSIREGSDDHAAPLDPGVIDSPTRPGVTPISAVRADALDNRRAEDHWFGGSSRFVVMVGSAS